MWRSKVEEEAAGRKRRGDVVVAEKTSTASESMIGQTKLRENRTNENAPEQLELQLDVAFMS